MSWQNDVIIKRVVAEDGNADDIGIKVSSVVGINEAADIGID